MFQTIGVYGFKRSGFRRGYSASLACRGCPRESLFGLVERIQKGSGGYLKLQAVFWVLVRGFTLSYHSGLIWIYST